MWRLNPGDHSVGGDLGKASHTPRQHSTGANDTYQSRNYKYYANVDEHYGSMMVQKEHWMPVLNNEARD